MVPRGVSSLRRALGPGARNWSLRNSFAVFPSQLLKLYRQDKMHILKLVLIAAAFPTSTYAVLMWYTHTCTRSHSHKGVIAHTTTTHQVPLGQVPDSVWTAVADAGPAHRAWWDYWRMSGLYPCSPQGYDSSLDWMNEGSARTKYYCKL